MSTDETYALTGFADPSGISMGFLVPLFSGRGSNTPLIQRLDTEGKIQGFEPYEAPDARSLAVETLEIREGDQGIHAFAFSQDDVAVIRNDEDRDLLRERLADPVLQERPLLSMELADFLKDSEKRQQFALQVYERMAKSSVDTADKWRDLSVLTTELRRVLARRNERVNNILSTSVVARVRNNVLEVGGIKGRLGEPQLKILRASAHSALRALSVLFREPPRGWEVRIVHDSGRGRKSEPDAAILLCRGKARKHLGGGLWPPTPNLDVYVEDGIDFTRVVEETDVPIFVAYDAEAPEVMRRATGDWTVREMHGIALGQPKRKMGFVEETREHWNKTYVPLSGIQGGPGKNRGHKLDVQLAVAAELDLRNAEWRRAHRSTTLLHARGPQMDPEGHAWAALYDRAWNMGLSPSNSIRLMSSNNNSDSGGSAQGWVEEALFHETKINLGPLTKKVLEESRSAAALLVDATPRSNEDEVHRKGAVTRLLESQGWSVRDADFRNPDEALEIRGQIRSKLRLGQAASRRGYLPPRQYFLDTDLRDLNGIVVTCGASPGSVFDQISDTRELAVDVRDLVGFGAEDGTFLSLVGAQLRRQVTGLPSRTRTMLLALVSMQAFQHGKVVASRASELQAAIESPGLGEDRHLVLRWARDSEEGVAAEVRILDMSDEVGRFALIVGSQYVTLMDPR